MFHKMRADRSVKRARCGPWHGIDCRLRSFLLSWLRLMLLLFQSKAKQYLLHELTKETQRQGLSKSELMILSRTYLAVQFAIAIGLGASAGAEKASQNFLRRKDLYISEGTDEAKVKVSKEDLAYHHGIQLENDRVSNKEIPHANSRRLQTPRHPELSVKPNGNRIDASATFYQGGQQSIKIFAGDCSTASPIQFTIGEMNPTNSYTYTAPANPATSIVEFEISLVGISFVRGLDNGDVVLCVELETANTLRHTLVRVDLDLYGAYSFGLYGEEQTADAAAVEESTPKSPVESKSPSRWRLGSEFRSKILFWWRSSSSSNRQRSPPPDR